MTITRIASRGVYAFAALPKVAVRMSRSKNRKGLRNASRRSRRSLSAGSRRSMMSTAARFSLSDFRRKLDEDVAMATRETKMYSNFIGSLRALSVSGRKGRGSSRKIHATTARVDTTAAATAGTTGGQRSSTIQAPLLAAGVTVSFLMGANFGQSTNVPESDLLDSEQWMERIPLTGPPAAGPSPYPYTYDASVGAQQGHRPYMEDNFMVRDGGRFAAVFDGHGGSGVSGFLRDHLYSSFVKYVREHEANCKPETAPSLSSRVNALREAFREVGREVVKVDSLQDQGSTAVAVILHEGEDGERTLVSANVGDSRAVLSRSGHAVPLTRDHKPNDPTERRRISSMGEEIEYDELGGTYRVRNLGVARSIGDRFAKPVVSGEPEMKRLPVKDDGDEFIILASDGLWDVFTSQEAVNYVHKKVSYASGSTDSEKRTGLSTIVAKEAIRRGSTDNVCVAIVWLN